MRRRASAVALGVLVVLAVAGSGVVWGAYKSAATNPGNELRAAPDFVAPAVAASVAQKTAGGTPGYVRPGGTFRVHAQVTDGGNPPSGTTSVTADVSTVAGGQTVAALTGGSFPIGTQAFNFRGASLSAGSAVANGTYEYTVRTTDAVGNASTRTGYSVVVDGTAPTAAAVTTTNRAGGTVGRPETGDSVTLVYSEPPDPAAILTGWTGAATPVVVRIDDDRWPSTPRNDLWRVFDAGNTAQLPLGSVDLGRRDYVNADRTFGGTGATMTLSGNTIVVVLGTASGSTSKASGTGTLAWTPSATATDRAGNPTATTTRTETGAADGDF